MTTSASTSAFSCAQVRGGNERIDVEVRLPGLWGWLVSHPCDGAHGGDVYYLSVCGSGLLARVCLADVVGHGEAVSHVSETLHDRLRRFVNQPDHRRILADLNRTLEADGLDAMTSAAIMTYYPPRRGLTFSYAGHPPGWLRPLGEPGWRRLEANPKPARSGFVDGLLGVETSARYTRTKRSAAIGDRLLLVTDGVLETMDEAGTTFDAAGVEASLSRQSDASPRAVVAGLMDDLDAHRGRAARLDDTTVILLEVTAGPTGPALWQVLRNRVLQPLHLVRRRTPLELQLEKS